MVALSLWWFTGHTFLESLCHQHHRMDALMCIKHWARPGVFVDVTTVASDDAEGVARSPRGKGAFIGAYRAPR